MKDDNAFVEHQYDIKDQRKKSAQAPYHGNNRKCHPAVAR